MEEIEEHFKMVQKKAKEEEEIKYEERKKIRELRSYEMQGLEYDDLNSDRANLINKGGTSSFKTVNRNQRDKILSGRLASA